MRRFRLARAVSVAVVATVMPLIALAAPPPQPSLLEFHRVHVPGERIGEVSLGPVRYVPMPLAEFDAAVARVEAARGREPASQPSPLFDTARYDIQIDERGGLVGTLVVTVGAGRGPPTARVPPPSGAAIHVRWPRANGDASRAGISVSGPCAGPLAMGPG